MSDGAGGRGETNASNRELSCIYHNLSVAERCLRYLLRAMKLDSETSECATDADPGAPLDYESLSRLCSVNIRLASEVNAAISQRRRRQEDRDPALGEPPAQEANATPDQAEHDRPFRESLVQLMVLAVQCWEQSTGKGKIELAEQSGIWCVNVDEGRLRVRSMDRYLGLRKLPKRPRWRDVLRTAYFVLDNVDGSRPIAARLEEALNHTLTIVRKQAS